MENKIVENDGGRAASGFKGSAGDCVVRAIAIANGLPYNQVYLHLKMNNEMYATTHRTRVAKKLQKRGSTPRNGNFKEVYHKYILSLGWKWTPTMTVGSGCTTHLKKEELPNGIIIAKVSRHLCAVIDGVVHDTHDPSRGGTRCVYGYYQKA